MAETTRRIAKREFIDAQGSETNNPMEAHGVRYTFLRTGGVIEFLFSELPEAAVRAFAGFGALTKLGNVVNTIVNDAEYDGRDPVPEVLGWLEELKKGVWRERAEGGGRAPKFDKDVLAGVIVSLLGSNAKGDVMHYRERLDDRSYYAKVRANPQIMAAYYEAVGGQADDNVGALA